jgi:hypothetical protein
MLVLDRNYYLEGFDVSRRTWAGISKGRISLIYFTSS